MAMQNGIFDQPGFLKGLFGLEPKMPFFGHLQNQNLSPIQNEFFQNRFQPFQNRFLGNTANFLQGGGHINKAPSFQDFLKGINLNQEFRSMPPGIRPGGSSAQFSPPTRFLF